MAAESRRYPPPRGGGSLPRTRRTQAALPAAALLLAGGYLAAAWALPALLPAVAAAAAVAACALAFVRRPAPGLARAVGAVALWLGVGFAGAWLLRPRPLAGLAWVLGVLFLLPLPLLPLLYARTFAAPPTPEEPPR